MGHIDFGVTCVFLLLFGNFLVLLDWDAIGRKIKYVLCVKRHSKK